MLRVTIDIVPHGYERHRETLEVIEIINTLTHEKRPEYGNYVVKHVTRPSEAALINLHIDDYLRENGPIALAKIALELVEDACRKSDGLLEAASTRSKKRSK